MGLRDLTMSTPSRVSDCPSGASPLSRLVLLSDFDGFHCFAKGLQSHPLFAAWTVATKIVMILNPPVEVKIWNNGRDLVVCWLPRRLISYMEFYPFPSWFCHWLYRRWSIF